MGFRLKDLFTRLHFRLEDFSTFMGFRLRSSELNRQTFIAGFKHATKIYTSSQEKSSTLHVLGLGLGLASVLGKGLKLFRFELELFQEDFSKFLL